MLFALVKATKTHDALMLLCEQGFVEDAGLLLRSLFELGVLVRYVRADPESRLHRYISFEAVEQYEALKLISSDPYMAEEWEELKSDEARIQEIQRSAREAQQDWAFWRKSEGDQLRQPATSWSGASVFQMAKDSGFESHYNLVYRVLSQRHHSSVGSANEYLKLLDEAKVGLNLGPQTQEQAMVLGAALGYLRTVTIGFCAAFNAPSKVREELQELTKSYEAGWTKVIGPERAERARRAGAQRGDRDEWW